MRILILDNYDSFTYNLVHYVEKIIGKSVDVFRNDEINLDQIKKYDKIILSPGPGLPDEAGILKDLIKTFAEEKSIFGVCLGMQAIAEVFDGSLYNLIEVYHGISSQMTIIDDSEIIFKNIPKTFEAGRYHSWMVEKNNFPDCLKITSVDDQNRIMSLRHKKQDVSGVQFHPESVLSPKGFQMLENWLLK